MGMLYELDEIEIKALLGPFAKLSSSDEESLSSDDVEE